MRAARTFMAVLLALSVALLPMAASMAAPAAPQPAAAASVDCDHHQHGHALPQKAPPVSDHCLVMASCGLCCVTLTGIGIAEPVQYSRIAATLDPEHLSGPPPSWAMAAPFRPPRA
jgi:hypothetical protein